MQSVSKITATSSILEYISSNNTLGQNLKSSYIPPSYIVYWSNRINASSCYSLFICEL